MIKFLTSYPVHSILGGFILGVAAIGFGLVYDITVLTTIGGLVIGLAVGGVALVYAAFVICIGFWR